MKGNVLLVRHLPSCLSTDEKLDFLKYFGAADALVMPSTGRMKHSAFAVFEDCQKAEEALPRLHQTELLNSVLSVEFAKRPQMNLSTKLTSEINKNGEEEMPSVSEETRDVELVKKKDNRGYCFPSSELLDYSSNPGLKYEYPEPNADTLINICAALLSVRKFYTQVLHLMNKMNLVPPFRPASTIPPDIVKLVTQSCNFALVPEERTELPSVDRDDNMDVDIETSESEYESGSSEDKNPRSLDLDVPERVLKSRKRKQRARIRLNVKKQRIKEMLLSKKEEPSSVGSAEVESVLDKRNIDIKVPERIVTDVLLSTNPEPEALEVESVGFGKIAPQKDISGVATEEASSKSETVIKDYISEKQLERGRLSKSEMSESSLFKNYAPGEPTCRLYIKNLAKKVTEKDLAFIFGHFVNFGDEGQRNMFNIQILTQGRMKGQAFVGLPSTEIAEKALKATNGYQLINKPMVVHFARSKKPN